MRRTLGSSSASRKATMSAAICATVHSTVAVVAVLRPNPRRSGASTRSEPSDASDGAARHLRAHSRWSSGAAAEPQSAAPGKATGGVRHPQQGACAPADPSAYRRKLVAFELASLGVTSGAVEHPRACVRQSLLRTDGTTRTRTTRIETRRGRADRVRRGPWARQHLQCIRDSVRAARAGGQPPPCPRTRARALAAPVPLRPDLPAPFASAGFAPSPRKKRQGTSNSRAHSSTSLH